MPAQRARVCRIAANLLNALGWKNYLVGSINGADATLTVSDAAFVAGDLGKPIAVDRAGAGGGILESIIVSVAGPTQVELDDQAAQGVAGASVSFGGELRDDRRNLFELNDLAFAADEAHYLAIAETKGHWGRQQLMALSTALLHNSSLKTTLPRVGPLGDVMIQAGPLDEYLRGERQDAATITRLRANTGISPNDIYGSQVHDAAGSKIGKYFWVPEDENTLQITGSSAKVYHIPPYTRGGDLQSPEVYESSMASYVVAQSLAKEGSRTPEHAAIHRAYCNYVIAGIRSGDKEVMSFEEFQKR